MLQQAYTQLGPTGLMIVAGECKPVGVGGITLGVTALRRVTPPPDIPR